MTSSICMACSVVNVLGSASGILLRLLCRVTNKELKKELKDLKQDKKGRFLQQMHAFLTHVCLCLGRGGMLFLNATEH